ILPFAHQAAGNVARPWQRQRPVVGHLPSVDDHCGLIFLEDAPERLEGHLARTGEGAPDRHAELIPAHVREPGRPEIVREPAALLAEWAVAVENDRLLLVRLQ